MCYLNDLTLDKVKILDRWLETCLNCSDRKSLLNTEMTIKLANLWWCFYNKSKTPKKVFRNFWLRNRTQVFTHNSTCGITQIPDIGVSSLAVIGCQKNMLKNLLCPKPLFLNLHDDQYDYIKSYKLVVMRSSANTIPIAQSRLHPLKVQRFNKPHRKTNIFIEQCHKNSV